MAKLSKEQLLERLKKIKLLALDVDGVLTDDSILFGPGGQEFKNFNISDGFFMVLAMRSGLELAIVSGRFSEATVSRMKDLEIKHVLQGKTGKVKMVAPLLEQLNISFDDIAFVGNEILDIPLAEKSGLSIAVADSSPRLIDTVDYVTSAKGGAGAVREIIEFYFEAIGIDPMEYVQ